MAGKKSNKVKFEERVSIVMEMLLSGLYRREILENIAKKDELKEWNVTASQIDNYIRAANNIILKPIEKDRDRLKAKAHSRYEYLYKKLLNVKDYKGAIAANDKVCTLLGLNEAQKMEHTGPGGSDLFKMTKEQLLERKKQLSKVLDKRT